MSERAIKVLALMESASVTGPAKNLIEFAKRAAEPEAGFPVVHLTLVTYTRGSTESEFVLAARQAGIPTFVLAESGRFDIKVIPQLKQIIADCRPDILQSHNIKSHFYVRVTGLFRQYPWVVFNHGYTTRDFTDRVYTQIDRWSLRAAYRVVAVCKPFADRLSKRGVQTHRIRVQHNSVKAFSSPATEDIETTRLELNLDSAAMILAVGRLSSEKGHHDLLNAIAQLTKVEGVPPFRLVLVGDGPEHQRLQESITSLGLQKVVTMAGHRLDVRPYYALASLLVLPSHSEGSPNVVLEAMAAGIPVVATSVGGVPEILEQDKTGLIVPARNPEALAKSIARLLQNDLLRRKIGAAGRDHVSRNFTPAAYKHALIRFYQEVLASRRVDAVN